MQSELRFALCAVLVFALLPAPVFAADVGSAAPPFRLSGSDGAVHALADYQGRHVVLAFFPKAFTGG